MGDTLITSFFQPLNGLNNVDSDDDFGGLDDPWNPHDNNNNLDFIAREDAELEDLDDEDIEREEIRLHLHLQTLSKELESLGDEEWLPGSKKRKAKGQGGCIA